MSLKASFDKAEQEFSTIHAQWLRQARTGGRLYTYDYVLAAFRRAAAKHSLFEEALGAYCQTLYDR
jgi:hypothetical protein